MLQARFAIIRGLARFWNKENLGRRMRSCIGLHNIIVEDERDTYASNFAELRSYDNVDSSISKLELDKEDLLCNVSII